MVRACRCHGCEIGWLAYVLWQVGGDANEALDGNSTNDDKNVKEELFLSSDHCITFNDRIIRHAVAANIFIIDGISNSKKLSRRLFLTGKVAAKAMAITMTKKSAAVFMLTSGSYQQL